VQHCGGCGKACLSTQDCAFGACKCKPGATLCGAQCPDLQTDPKHCGGCFAGCPPGFACSAGKCACPAGQTECGGTCANLQTSSFHCGACFQSCGPGTCSAGSCICPAPLTKCGNACVDLTKDLQHCGACDQSCSAGFCSAGVCTCPTGLTQCGGACVDLMSSGDHCGSCDTGCDDGVMCTKDACVAGTCSSSGVPPAVTYFSETFADGSKGWKLDPEWAIGPAKASSGQDYGGPDPALDHSSGADNGVAGVVIGGNAAKILHDYYWLTSPAVDTSGALGSVVLSFYRWLNSDYLPYMQNQIQVFDGTAWVTIWETSFEAGIPKDASWTFQQLDLTQFKNDALQVRFGFRVGSSGVFSVSSWNLDDVVIASGPCP
jgi:hypothetical protein